MVDKGLLPLDSNDYVVCALTFLASALGAAGGIGGGGIMVPMLVSVGGFRCVEPPRPGRPPPRPGAPVHLKPRPPRRADDRARIPSVHHAIPLTQATVFGAAVMNLIHNAPKRHPGVLSADAPCACGRSVCFVHCSSRAARASAQG